MWEEWRAQYRDVTAWEVCVYAVLFGQECLCMGSVHKRMHVPMRMRVDTYVFVCVYECVFTVRLSVHCRHVYHTQRFACMLYLTQSFLPRMRVHSLHVIEALISKPPIGVMWHTDEIHGRHSKIVEMK